MPADPVGQQALDRALDEKEDLLLVYQPIHHARTRKIVAAEALLRQRRESGELRETTIITATAERGPELFVLDSITFRTAFTDAATWMAKTPHTRLNVNLSPREFQERDILPRLESLVGECKVDLTRINLEITETSYIERPDETVELLAGLRELGIQLWLDDFGTGHSTLSHLMHLDVHGLKLPGEFVSDIGVNERSS
ncbi:MAG TPA: EAL domain-containing protein, partial [Thermoanaerobaculia bacterium]|nr:EAL domain-containing protein [Thermoanaerobaculia bacterium]